MKKALIPIIAIFLFSCGSTKNYVIKRDYDFSRIKKIAVLKFRDYSDSRNSGSVVSDYLIHKLLEGGIDVVYKNMEYESISDLKTISKDMEADIFLVGTVVKYVKEKKIIVMEGETQEVSIPTNRTSIKITNPKIIVTDTDVMWYPYQKTYDVASEVDITAQLIDVKSSDVIWSGHEFCNGIDLNIALDCALNPICNSIIELVPKK